MDGDVVGAGQELIELHQLHPDFFRGIPSDVGIVGDDLHLEPQGPIGHDDPDPAQAYDA